jgi:hypothetical protein
MKKTDIFIEDKVWEMNIKYVRMMRKTKEKFFEYLLDNRSIKDYSRGIKELWDIDHSFMDKQIKELEKMVSEIDIKDYEKYEKPLTKQTSEKITNGKLYYEVSDYQIYQLNPDSDFVKIEQQYVNKHIKFYERQKEILVKTPDKEEYLSKIVERYDKIDKTIPYFNKNGTIKCYNTVATYNSMLYNWNLTHSAWNRTMYDAEVLDNHLFYLPAHPNACEMCAGFQGKVYADKKGLGYPLKETAIRGGVGHPNCKHVWTLFWDEAQIQEEKWNSPEDIENYKTKQKIQSLDLEKSRLLSDRRIYQKLGDQASVDECTLKIKALRNKINELK